MRWAQTMCATAVLLLASHAGAQPLMQRGSISVKPAKLAEHRVRLQFDRATFALKSCYSKGLKRKAGLHGSVVARFWIRRDGTVSGSRAKGLGHDVAGCVARTVATLRFAKPERRVHVRVELHFDTNKYRLRRTVRRKKVKPATLRKGGAFRSLKGGTIYKGGTTGPMQGGWGFGRSGVGRGGGGTGWGTIGTGRYGTIGHGRGRLTRPTIRMSRVTARGPLSRHIIRRYLRRKRTYMGYCYERQLMKAPTLKGRVGVRFRIGPSGNVVSARASGVHKTVAGCIRQLVKQIQFPRPRRSGRVAVRFSMDFAPPKKPRPKTKSRPTRLQRVPAGKSKKRP